MGPQLFKDLIVGTLTEQVAVQFCNEAGTGRSSRPFLLWFYCFFLNFSYSYASRSLKIAPPDGGRVTESLPFSTGIEGASASRRFMAWDAGNGTGMERTAGWLSLLTAERIIVFSPSRPNAYWRLVRRSSLYVPSWSSVIPVDPGQGGDMVRDGAGLLFHIL